MRGGRVTILRAAVGREAEQRRSLPYAIHDWFSLGSLSAAPFRFSLVA